LWYTPPPEAFEKLQRYANQHGHAEGRPYFSRDGQVPMTAADWMKMRTKFKCPYGVTNIWRRPALHGKERVQVRGGKAIHLNQKPADLTAMTISAASDVGDVIWEPFGGLFTACLAARSLGRRAFGAEIDPTYYQFGIDRLRHAQLELTQN
jgi:DNA modification methylase